MSSAAQAQPASPAQGQTGQTGQTQGQTGQTQGQPQGQGARRGGLAPRVQQLTSSTPRMLRVLRTAAAGAALLTGLVTTGGLATDGAVGSTPGAVAERWAASERAGVDMAHANQLAAQRVLDGDADEGVRAAYDQSITSVTLDLSRTGWVPGHSAQDAERMTQEWSTFVTGAERAATTAASGDAAAAVELYGPAADAGRTAAWSTGDVSATLSDSVGLGGGSTPAVVVGTLATLIMAGALVWVALRSRRIINVPLLIATLITAGLTYSAANPGVLPTDTTDRLESGSQAAAALQDVYLARQAQYALALDLDQDGAAWPEMIARAQSSVADLEDQDLADAFGALRQQGDAAERGEPSAVEALQASQEPFQTLEAGLREDTDRLLTADGIGTPATVTSTAALLLGLTASVLAWIGLSRRLKDYR